MSNINYTTSLKTGGWVGLAVTAYQAAIVLFIAKSPLSILFVSGVATNVLLPIAIAFVAGVLLSSMIQLALPSFSKLNVYIWHQTPTERADVPKATEKTLEKESKVLHTLAVWDSLHPHPHSNEMGTQANQQNVFFFSIFKKLISGISYFGHVFAANILTQNGLLRTARYFPPAGRLFEYTNFANTKGLDDLHHYIKVKDEEAALQVIKLIPKDSLDRMLVRRDPFNYTPLHNAAMHLPNTRVFSQLLAALKPEHRLKHLTAIIGRGIVEMPLVFHLVCHFLDRERMQPIWDVVMSHLTPEQKVKLITHHDQKGDSLLAYQFFSNRDKMLDSLFAPLSRAQKIACFTEVCPHGTTPLLALASKSRLVVLKKIFALLEQDDWQEIFAYKPQGWTMNHGEKLMVIAHAAECPKNIKKGSIKEKIPYFIKEFGLKLPTIYQSMPQDELGEICYQVRRYMLQAPCKVKHNFKIKHGQTPEEILNLEAFLPPKAYLVSYRNQQRLWHPDKNIAANAHDRSALLNEAHAFMSDEDVRKSY